MSISLHELARDGARGNEGVMLWLGNRTNGDAEINHLVGLRGRGITRAPLLLRISDGLVNDVADLAIKLGVAIVGQIHGHPGTFVDLSPTDKKFGFNVPGFLSVVAPFYGLNDAVGFDDCGVHVYEPLTGYRRLGRDEIRNRLVITDLGTTQVHLVGA